MTSDQHEPDTKDLEEPSTEKEPGEEPTADAPEEGEPNHEAVGIGIVGGPLTDRQDAAPGADAEA